MIRRHDNVIRARLRSARMKNGAPHIEIALTIGAPNYAARQFIKRCKQAGEPFPVKKLRFTYAKPRKPKKAKRTKRIRSRKAR
jgi:hypothetical protein